MATASVEDEKPPLKGYKPKIPVLRIKRLIQADEEVGKVAHATPLIVERALGLFLGELVQATAKQAESTGTKRITSTHLKKVINTQETFDFLKDKVENVQEVVPKEKTKKNKIKRKKKESSSDEDSS